MHNGNPLAPGTPWLDSVAHPHGGHNEAAVGDSGEVQLSRETGSFRVTVEKIDPNEERNPFLPVRESARIGPNAEAVIEVDSDLRGDERAETHATRLAADLKGRAQQLDAMLTEGTHPDDAESQVGIDWEELLDLDRADGGA